MVSETEQEVGSGTGGYILETKDGVRIYYAGDTGIFGDMRLIADLYNPNLAIVPADGKYNMGVREAAYAAFLIKRAHRTCESIHSFLCKK